MLAPDAPGADEEVVMPGVRRFRVGVAGWVGAGPQQLEEINGQHVVVEEEFARGKDLQAFRVRGDSMAAGKRPIYDGDIVIVNVRDKGYNTAAVVARLVDGRYVCKMLKDDHHGKMLVSANPVHTNGTPTSIPIEQVDEIVGRVVRVIGNENDGETHAH
jgi:repressor LexA